MNNSWAKQIKQLRQYDVGWQKVNLRGTFAGIYGAAVIPLFLSVLVFLNPLVSENIENLKKGVVRMEVKTHEGKQNVGSGFVVWLESGAAYIVTASHVVEDAEEIKVEFFTRRNQQILAKVIQMEGADPQGLAALKVEAGIPSDLIALQLDSSMSVSSGDSILAIGFPQIAGVPWASITGSIVGNMGKAISFTGGVDEGNSGGPLIKEGKVAGVVMGVSGQFGYAIPSSIAEVLLKNWGIGNPDPDRIFIDDRTGLMWTRKDNGVGFNWSGADAYCKNLTIGGYNDWRLPTLKELNLIYDPNNVTGHFPLSGRDYPIHTISKFQLTTPSVWSSTKEGSDSAWVFGFNDGKPGPSPLNYSGGNCRALCVRRSGN